MKRECVGAIIAITIIFLSLRAEGFASWTWQKSLTRKSVALRDAMRMKSNDKNNDRNSSEDKSERQPNFWTGLAQLVTMGAGAPSLGEFKEIDDRGRAIFELEANNLVDADGNVIQTRAKFFESGYVADSEEDIKAPGFFENLLSGGKAMREWEDERKRNK